MLALPDGYKVGPTTRQQVKAHHKMLGSDWEIVIYYRGYDAFKMVKQFDVYTQRPRFAARLDGTGKWQQFDDLNTMVRVMCTKHRMGVGR